MAQAPVKHIVTLTDKQTQSYSLENPEAFLSQRAIERRARMGVEITLRDLPVSPEYVKDINQRGFRITNRIKWLNTLIVEGTEGKEALASLPFVKSVETINNANFETSTKPFFEAETYDIQSDNRALKQSRDENVYDYGDGYNQIELMNGHLVHNAGFDGEGMEIAVLDGGFSRVDDLEAFDSLWINEQILGTRNYVNTEDVFGPSISSHGMMVLSTMGGNLPGQLVGTAPKAKYWLVRTEDTSEEYLLEEYYWVDGAEFADSAGVDIINSSLGYTEFDDPGENHTYEDMDGNTTPITIGADIAASVGILVVNSAGNSGQSSWFYIGAPADGDSVLAVGAVDSNGDYAAFSSKGPSADGRVKPNVAAKGAAATVASSWGGITFSNGTSFSSPIMAGMIASIWQASPGLSNMDLIQLIQEHGNQYSEPDSLLGYGIPDFGAMLDIIGTGDIAVDMPQHLKVWPNPFESRMIVEAPVLMKSVALYDIAGNILSERVTDGARILSLDNLSHLPQGVYVLKVHTVDSFITKKVVKR